MDHKLNLMRVGWTVSLFSVIMHVIALIRMSTLSAQSRELMETLAAIGHPGFSELTVGGAVILLVEAFVYGWVISAVFVGFYNAFHREARP